MSGPVNGKLLAAMLGAAMAARSDSARFGRGRAYVRDGSVTAIDVGGGVLTGKVAGSRRYPYDVSIRVPTLGANAFELLQSGAKGLNDLMPGARELRCECSCPDDVATCKHAVAVVLAFADQLAIHPDLVVQWRGGLPASLEPPIPRRRRFGAGSSAGRSGDVNDGPSARMSDGTYDDDFQPDDGYVDDDDEDDFDGEDALEDQDDLEDEDDFDDEESEDDRWIADHLGVGFSRHRDRDTNVIDLGAERARRARPEPPARAERPNRTPPTPSIDPAIASFLGLTDTPAPLPGLPTLEELPVAHVKVGEVDLGAIVADALDLVRTTLRS